mgnify:CR=1 FL=1
MLKRKIESEIKKWISAGRKALLIDGARQVGKTYSIRHCLKDSGKDYVEINLLNNRDAFMALSDSMTVKDLVINLSAATGHTFIAGETIIFIDEVQQLTDIVTRIKFWVDEGSFRFILSGSLLGVELRNLRSAPVGYVHEIKMYPMDFEEFLSASEVSEDVIGHLRECFEKRRAVGEVIHGKIMQLFYRYLVVGGMPQAVQEYASTGNIGEVTSIQKDIINYYDRDYTKYEQEDKKLMLSSIFDIIPAQLLKQNRRFNYADIKKGLRFEKIESSFLWLYKAGVVLPAFNVTEPRIALRLNEKSSLVKLYYSDCGLLTCRLGDAVRRELLYGETLANMGGIFENAVIQELTAHDFRVYYYNSKKLGELDFCIEYNGKVLPIEVKSGKDYYVHSAINNVLNNAEFGVKEAYVFSGYDISVEGGITYYPIYMTAFLQPDTELPTVKPVPFTMT